MVAWYTYPHPCFSKLGSRNAPQLSKAGYGTLAWINGGLDPAKKHIVQDYKSLFWKDHSILLCMRRLLSAAEQLSKAGYGTLAWIMAAWAQPRR